MSTNTHDTMIKKAVRWAKSLGYDVVDQNLGTKTGADAVFQNHFNEKVILEVVTGSSFKNLFKKERIRKELIPLGKYSVRTFLGLIVVADRLHLLMKHGVEVGIPEKLFDNPKEQKIFAVEAIDFKEVIPVLLVSLLGSRASAYAGFD